MTENLTVRTERKLVCLRAEDNYLREGVAKKQMSESSRPLISRQKKKKVFGYTAYVYPTKYLLGGIHEYSDLNLYHLCKKFEY